MSLDTDLRKIDNLHNLKNFAYSNSANFSKLYIQWKNLSKVKESKKNTLFVDIDDTLNNKFRLAFENVCTEKEFVKRDIDTNVKRDKFILNYVEDIFGKVRAGEFSYNTFKEKIYTSLINVVDDFENKPSKEFLYFYTDKFFYELNKNNKKFHENVNSCNDFGKQVKGIYSEEDFPEVVYNKQSSYISLEKNGEILSLIGDNDYDVNTIRKRKINSKQKIYYHLRKINKNSEAEINAEDEVTFENVLGAKTFAERNNLSLKINVYESDVRKYNVMKKIIEKQPDLLKDVTIHYGKGENILF